LLAFVTPTAWCRITGLRLSIGEFSADPGIVFFSGPYIYYNTPAWQKWLVHWMYWRGLGRIIYFFTGYMAAGGNMVMSKQALQKIGGFDTSIAFYGEDTDIARRLHQIGKTKFNFDFTC